MQLPPFEYHRPNSLDEALLTLSNAGESAAVLGGGTDLLINLKLRLETPAALVSVRDLPELAGVSVDSSGTLRIGAGERLTDLATNSLIVARYPGLAQAIRAVGSQHVRNMATLGGNLCLPTRCWYTNQSENWRGSQQPCWKTDGAVCHVIKTAPNCRAIHSADSVPALIALSARVLLRSTQGERELPLADFYRDDGIDNNALAAGELITAVLVPPADLRSVFVKAAARTGLDYGYATLAGTLGGSNRAPKSLLLVAGSVGTVPLVLRKSVAIILAEGLTEASIEAAADAARDDLGEVTNLYTPPGYKKRLVRGLVRRVLNELRRQKLPVEG
ncbi:MAG: FAD binding domain-containing protein [Gammaproteobacteria bacterium]